MATISPTRINELVKEERWDAEFYKPEYRLPKTLHSMWVPIGRLLASCEYGSSLPLNEEKKGFPIFRLNEIENALLTAPEKHVQMPLTDYERLRLEIDDILFCRTNGNINFVGRTGILKEQLDACFASYLVRVRTNRKLLLPEYLTVYLNSSFGRKQILRRTMPSNQVNVSGAQLKRIPILLPKNPDFQKEIADLFNEYARRVLQSRSLYREAEEILSNELGIDHLDFTHLLGHGTTLSEITKAHRWDPQCFDPGFLRYEVLVQKYGKFAPLDAIVEPPIKGQQRDAAEDGNISYASIKHICDFEIITDEKVYVQVPAGKLAVKDDLLLAITGATIGKVGIVSRYEALAYSGDLLQLRCRDGIDPNYFLVFLRSPVGQGMLLRWVTGSTNGHLAARDVLKVHVPRLGKKEQQIRDKVREALSARRSAENLFEKAKGRVEELIQKETSR